MALISCNQCQSHISIEAISCPKCGAPQDPVANLARQQAEAKNSQKIGLVVIAVLVLGFVVSHLQPDYVPFTPSGKGSISPRTQAADEHVEATVKANTDLSVISAAMNPSDVKSFSGSDKLTVGGVLAAINVSQSSDEKKYLNDFSCIDESECYGPKKFERFILSKYPDIARIRFNPPRDIAEDKETSAYTKQDFRRGLYFAKQIKLANGQTLFNFLTKCSKNVSPMNWAQVNWAKEGSNTAYIYMQYFPILRQKDTGKEFEMQILLNRTGDRIEAMSPLFSSAILSNSNFMDKHGVSCW